MIQVTGRPFRKLWEIFVIVLATSLLIYQVNLNVGVYMAKPTILKVSLEPVEIFQLPPVSICPHPPFRPDALKVLGVDISGNYMEVERKLLVLKGLSQTTETLKLWNDASWTLGQVIDRVSVRGVTEFYNSSSTKSPLWRKSFSPLGPCYTFLAPVNTSDIIITLRVTPEIKACKWRDERGNWKIYNPADRICDNLSDICNTSCGFEDYIHFRIHAHEFAFVFFHRTLRFHVLKYESSKNILHFSKKLFDGNYKLVRVNNEPNPISKAQLVEKYQVKDSCISDSSFSQEDCFSKIQETIILDRFGCLPVTDKTLSRPLNLTCSSPDLIKRIANWYQSTDKVCSEKCYDKSWLQDVTDLWVAQFTIFLSMASKALRKEEEIETYPLSQLFSDIGGSLGLFLSISAFIGWKSFNSVLEYAYCSISGRSAYNIHFKALMEYVAILILLTVTGTHCIEVLRSYLSQPSLTSVYLKTQSTKDRDSTTRALAHRFASRALDCKQEEHLYHDSLAQCILMDVVMELDSVSPFIYLDDLPYCHEKSFMIKSPSYIVPSDLLMVSTLPSKVDHCKKVLKLHGINQSTLTSSNNISLQMVIDDSYYSTDVLQLLCNLGGIIGLYLGFSAMQGIDLLVDISKKQGTCKNHKFYISLLNYIKFFIYLSGFILTAWLAVRFYLFRTFSSTVSSESAKTSGRSLALTVCRWPSLNIPYLAEKEGINITEKELKKLPSKERLATIIESLSNLEEQGNSSVVDIWHRAAWTLPDVIGVTTDEKYFFFDCMGEISCKEIWKPVSTVLNQCFTMETAGRNASYSKIFLTFPRDVDKKALLGDYPQIYFTVIPSGDPPLLSDMIPRKSYERVIATVHSAEYKHLDTEMYSDNKNSLSYRQCVYKCLEDAVIKLYGCQLPYMKRPSKKFCNHSQYKAIPKCYKGLDGIGRFWNDLLIWQGQSSHDTKCFWKKCYIKCRHLSSTFYELSVQRFPDPYPSIEIRLEQKKSVRVMEVETQTVAQLVSDIGGIAGITIGFSLLILLKVAAPEETHKK